MNFVEPIRDVRTVQAIADYLKQKDERYYIMYMIGIYSGLRISDILKLRVCDVRFKERITIREKKTGKARTFPINARLKKALNEYCRGKSSLDFLVQSKRSITRKAVSREYAYRVMREAGELVGLDNLGTHTLRKTFGYHFYMQYGDIVMLMQILNHTNERETLRYIGIEQETIDTAIAKFHY